MGVEVPVKVIVDVLVGVEVAVTIKMVAPFRGKPLN